MRLVQPKSNRYVVYNDAGKIVIVTSYKQIANNIIRDYQEGSVKTETDSQSQDTD